MEEDGVHDVMNDDRADPFGTARRAVVDGQDPVDAARTVVAAMSRSELLWCLDGDAPAWAGLEHLGTGGYHEAPFFAARVERVGMPGIAFVDGPRGVVIGNATCFPVSMARGATWDRELEERVGDAIGKELRASGASLYGGVCVNLLRHPAWGRAQETYGEDPHHVGEMGAALTRGIQRHAMATVKHFAVNSMENARFKVDVEVDEIALHEVYLAQFKRIVDEGVACVMSAYNHMNGLCCGDHPTLLTDILREEWGFEGFVISDWILGLRDAAASLRAGLDIEMPYRMVRFSHLEEALAAADVTWDDVEAAVTRIVASLLRFDAVLSSPSPDGSIIGCESHVALAREVAARSVVVLRNESVDHTPILPIDRSTIRSIAVVGSLADQVNLGDGGSSDVFSLENITVLDGIRRAAPGMEIVHVDGGEIDEAVAAAAAADLVVVVAGYTREHEGEFIGDTGVDLGHLFPAADDAELAEAFRQAVPGRLPTVRPPHVPERGNGVGFSVGGDRASLTLLAHDEAVIEAVAAVNPRSVVVLQAGSAVVSSSWAESVAGIVQPWYGGQEAGTGLADVLFGDANPSARLPFTVPADEADLPPFDRDADHVVYDRWHGWWRSEDRDLSPAFPFGFGLSYTTFELGSGSVVVAEDGLVVTTTVTNTGDRDGADVVQVYARLPDPAAPRRLVGFERVEVAAGAVAPVTIEIPFSRLATRHPTDRCWTPPEGEYQITIARHAADASGGSHPVSIMQSGDG